MKKLVFLFLILLSFISVYADTIDDIAGNFTGDYSSPSQEDNISESEAKGAKKQALEIANSLQNDMENSGKIARTIGDLIDKIMLQFVNVHNNLFGLNEVSSSLQMPSFNRGIKNVRNSMGTTLIFRFFLTLFIVIYFLVYSIKLSLSVNFQYQELLSVFWRFIICLIIFFIMPYLPTMFIRFAFHIAEILTGSKTWNEGVILTYSSPIYMTTDVGRTLLATGGTALLTSLFELGATFVVSINLSLSSISTLTALIFGFFVAALIGSIIVSLQFCIRCLDLYITNIIMCIALPGTLLKGWGNESFLGYDSKTLIKYYIVNFIEIFVGAITILIVKKVFQNIRPTGTGASLWLINLIQFVAQPTILMILMPASSKILSSLLSGSVSDNNADVTSAVRTLGSSTALAGSAKLISGINKKTASIKSPLKELKKENKMLDFMKSQSKIYGKKALKASQSENDDKYNKFRDLEKYTKKRATVLEKGFYGSENMRRNSKKARVVRDWQKANPTGSKADFIKETGISRSTADRYWNKKNKS